LRYFLKKVNLNKPMLSFKKKNQAVEDELLKEFFPHIFERFKNNIREYWAKKDKENWQTISEKLKETTMKSLNWSAKKIAEMKLDEEHNKEVIKNLEFKSNIIHNMLIEQGKICDKEREKREITDEELNFTLYFFWKNLSQKQWIFPNDISLLKEFFNWFPLKEK